jgi:hypothetical protein
MNAYELADKLMSSLTMEYDCDKYMEQAATMLRHQADRIAELENQLDKCSHHEAMAHQGGYEIGYAEGLKKASEK